MRKNTTGFGVLMAFGLIGAGVFTWSPLPQNASQETLAAGAKSFDAEIVRDKWGVPHIYGARDADASFGLGYAQAEDDFETLQLVTAAGRGVLARYQGKGAATTDYLINLMGIWDRLDRRYAQEVPDDVKQSARAFVAGVNLYASEHKEKNWQGLMPMTEQDVVAGFMFKTPLFYGFDARLLELFGDERAETISLDPTKTEAFHVGPKPMAKRGSNAFAVSPKRSGDGITRLFINSHQPLTGPVAWYEAHMVSRAGLDIQGGLFPGTPIVLSGFNQHLGWANTVNNPDLTDIFVLTINPKNKYQYKLDGQWTDFEKSTARINVKLFGPFAYKAKRDVLRSVHGPVVETPRGHYALKYAGMDEVRQLEQYIRLSKTDSLESFMGVMAMNALPSINYVYGDKDGNIGFIHNAQYPDRVTGWDWQKYLPGDRSDLNWDRYLPFSAVPRLINPESGFLWNANNDPTRATDGADNLSRADHPAHMGLQTNMTNRALRIEELTANEGDISRARLLTMKFDNSYAKGSEADLLIKDVLSMDFSGAPNLHAAQAHLAQWDYGTDMENRHAALGVLSVLDEITEKYTGDPAPSHRDAFVSAVDYLTAHYGRIDPKWGELNRLERGEASAPISGGPDVLRAIYPKARGEDGVLTAGSGDSYVALVEWDSEGRQTAHVIQPFGSNVEDRGSVHHNDQLPLFAAQKLRAIELDEAKIRAQASEIYSPGAR
ncbi:MAG: penicillin acylase family protein [Robiginitomaculum sp.]